MVALAMLGCPTEDDLITEEIPIATPAPGAPAADQGPRDILVVEADAGRAQWVFWALIGRGPIHAALHHAVNLEAAREHLRAQVPELILLDLNGPMAPGVDAIRALRDGCDAAIVAVGPPDDALELGAVRAGAQEYLRDGDLRPEALSRAIRHAFERQRARDRLTAMAHQDPVTGLLNRAIFDKRFNQSVARAAAAKQCLALMYLDLDGFKQVNDTHGHDAGDAVLRVVADRIRHSVRASDAVARIGGDEFTVILEDLPGPEIAERLAERIISALALPIAFGGLKLEIAASVGIACYPTDGRTSKQLLRSADWAMYHAKRAGAGGYVFAAELRETDERDALVFDDDTELDLVELSP